MRHEAKGRRETFFCLSGVVQSEMTSGTAWNTLWRWVTSTGSYEYKDSITVSIVL